MKPIEPQGVLSGLTEAAICLTMTVGEGGDERVADLLADLGGLRRSVGFRAVDAGLSCVAGVGSDAWDRLFGAPRPAELHPFPGFAGSRHRAPSTPGDLLFHIRARRMDVCFELGHRITSRLDGAAQVVDEVHGFRYFDERDLLGFVDGTENQEGLSARAAVTIADEDPPFRGGSYVITQNYLHDLVSWNALTIEDQELAMGRTKLDDIELADEEQPTNSHVALNTVVDADGEEQKIVRFNMPFGAVGASQFGTFFIGYARSPGAMEQMLTNMFVGNPPGNHDRLLDFSTAMTGNLFFVPTVDILEAPGSRAVWVSDGCPTGVPDTPAPHGSLAIGGLRDR